MEKYFHNVLRGLQHKYHTYRHHLPYHHAIEKFLKSKNAHLIILLIIAAAIPITVLAVQQIQDIRQQAEEGLPKCDASKVLNVTNNTDFKSSTAEAPFKDGEEIIFSHTSGPITDTMFQNQDYTGNGATGCKLDSANGWIRCKARYTNKKGNKYSEHTWEFHNDGILKCNYYVANPDANKPTKPSKAVTNTPKVPKTSKTPTEKKCEVNLSDYNCTGDNKPRLRASWDMEGGDKGCVVKVNGKDFSKECQNSSENIIKVDDKDLVSGTTYEISIDGTSCKKSVSEKAPNCSGGKTPTNTPKPGEKTPTPTTQQPQPCQNASSQTEGSAGGKPQCINNGQLIDCKACPTPTKVPFVPPTRS